MSFNFLFFCLFRSHQFRTLNQRGRYYPWFEERDERLGFYEAMVRKERKEQKQKRKSAKKNQEAKEREILRQELIQLIRRVRTEIEREREELQKVNRLGCFDLL